MDVLSSLHASPSPSSPAQSQSLDYLICPAAPPATTTGRASSTEASPALQPETRDRGRAVSPCPAAAAARRRRRRSLRSRLLLLGLWVEGRTTKTRWREGCWRAWPGGRCRPPPPPLHHSPCPSQTLWFPPSTCRWLLRNTPATHFTSSDSRRRRRRKMEERRAEPGLYLHRRGGHIHHSSTSCPTTTNISTRSPCSPSTSIQVRVKGRPRPSTPLLCSPGRCSTAGHIWRLHISAGAVPAGFSLPPCSRAETAADGTVEQLLNQEADFRRFGGFCGV